jgi:hypothetical protein
MNASARAAVAVFGAVALIAGFSAPAGAATSTPVHDEQITYQGWSTYRDWRTGTHQGTLALPGIPGVPGLQGGVTILRPQGTSDYTDPHTGVTRSYNYATWTSPKRDVGFDASELVASWNAETPRGTWIQIEMQGTYNTGNLTPWYVMGRWASGDQDIRRTSVNRQGDPYSTIWTDTFSIDDVANGVMLSGYQLRLTLYRAPGQLASPRVWALGAMSSYVPDRFTVPASAGHIAWGKELKVPAYSQNIHEGHYPEYDGGGEAWCSPTSTAMVLGYYGRLPAPSSYAWAGSRTDPWVDEVARRTYDVAYEGTGNWPFNTAYAASRGLSAFVTRLHSLSDAETLVAAGIPVIASVSFPAGGLHGAPISATAGHLLVIVGFTPSGDVVVNDPAASSASGVRRTYDRAQFEASWLGGSGGTVYVIHDAAHPLPASPGNW